MRLKIIMFPASPILLLALLAFDSAVCAVEERQVLSRNYVGVGVDVYAPYQSCPNENITIRVRVEVLEDIRNVSITLSVWGSKSEGYSPWATSFTVLEATDLLTGTINEETDNITIPADTDPGLVYGILFLDWSICRKTSWEAQWDKASFRATYVRNSDYESLQALHSQLEIELSNWRAITYIFAATTIGLVVSMVHSRKRK